jgi:hypothetical protein
MVFDQDIGVARQAFEDFRAAGRSGIERQAFLAGVEVKKEPALLGMRQVGGERRMAACLVAEAGRFDLDHLGAHVGKQLAAHRSRDHPCVLYDFQIVQRCRAQFRRLPKFIFVRTSFFCELRHAKGPAGCVNGFIAQFAHQHYLPRHRGARSAGATTT